MLNTFLTQSCSQGGSVQTEEIEDTRGEIRNLKSKRDRQHNGQQEKDKITPNDLQNTTQKTNDRATLKAGGELRCSGMVAVPAPLVTPISLHYVFQPNVLFQTYVFILQLHLTYMAVVGIAQQLHLQLPVQSPLKNLVHGEVYSIQHYVMKFVSDLRQVGCFHRYSGFLHQ